MTKEESQENIPRNIERSDIDFYITTALKLMSILFLLLMAISLFVIHKKYAHAGPSCDDYKEDFQYWLSENGKNKNKILSVETSRIQLENGTTNCHGAYKTGKGQYQSWTGSITLLDDGEIIGSASE